MKGRNTDNKPKWLKIKLTDSSAYRHMKHIVSQHKLHTICESGRCPNKGECWGAGTATFMILGDICTRNCRFCAVTTGKPAPPDENEPKNIVRSAQLMELRHCVLTSVTRDDLPDQGARHWHEVISRLKRDIEGITVEALIPDMGAQAGLLETIASAGADLIAHNMETVERLSPLIRPQADYNRSLESLRILARLGQRTKTGLMVGLGESDAEVLQAMGHILETGCKILTIGQYLQPTNEHQPVARYVEPGLFDNYKNQALGMGFEVVESAPLVRSSYHAEKHLIKKA